MTVVRRLFALTDAPAHPRWARVLTVSVAVTALAVAVAGLALPVTWPPAEPLPPPARIGLAVAAMTVAMLAGLRVRVAAGVSTICWGEAAVVVGLFLVPPGWLPGAALLGAAGAGVLLSIFLRGRTPADVLHLAASVAVAVAVASAVATGLGPPLDRALTPAAAAVLAAAALAYFLTTAAIGAMTITAHHGSPFRVALLGHLRAKAVMFLGNLVVGLGAVAAIQVEPAWLLLLPPVVWVLQQTYVQRMHAAEESRVWRRLAAALDALNTLDEREVATAGVTGALDLMGADQAELDIVHVDGGRRRYRVDAGGEIAVDTESVTAAPSSSGSRLHRPLTVGGATVGELRVRLPRPVAPTPRDELILSAYGDALAVALHNAVDHRALQTLTERSAYEAGHDPLTGLANRRALVRQGDSALRRLPPERPVALVVVDIDRFKEVNDTLGHRAGDELLTATASRLVALARPDELVGRLGADEFGLLTAALPESSAYDGPDDGAALTEALARAQALAEALATPTDLAGVTMAVEVSAGVALAPAGAADLSELVRRAGLAVAEAKQRASKVAAYDSGQDAATADHLVLLAELREALAADDQLVLALQPAVDLATGGPAGVEALIRWHHPRRGMLHPVDFIRAVEASDVHGQFTRYVIDRALAVAARWAAEGIDVPISVNVSARSLLDPRLPTDVGELLRRHGVAPSQLVVEITETVVMSELQVIDEVLAALQEIGVQLAVDDFGTGFSSLAFLARISVDELKIDRSFVMAMTESPEAAAIVGTIVDLGRRLGLRVVAEGVETAEQRAALSELGCSAAQGYLLFKPLPADKIAAVLRSLAEAADAAQVVPLRADDAS
jgi:diguanylate cyclase (GGDEF)-like protein